MQRFMDNIRAGGGGGGQRFEPVEQTYVPRTNTPPVASPGSSSTPSPLKSIRLQRRIPQERLAALAGLSRGWVGFLERNPESMTTTAAEKLAAVLGVAAKELQP
jgi:DNA-binding XRE family transcriptional regulator